MMEVVRLGAPGFKVCVERGVATGPGGERGGEFFGGANLVGVAPEPVKQRACIRLSAVRLRGGVVCGTVDECDQRAPRLLTHRAACSARHSEQQRRRDRIHILPSFL
jgi:hypothetical protein